MLYSGRELAKVKFVSEHVINRTPMTRYDVTNLTFKK